MHVFFEVYSEPGNGMRPFANYEKYASFFNIPAYSGEVGYSDLQSN
jgi:hypothetical protein